MKQPPGWGALGRAERWFSLFEHVSDGIIVSDARFRVLYVNPAARKILRIDDRPRTLSDVCALVTSSLHIARLGRCLEICPLRDSHPRLETGVTVQAEEVRVRCLTGPEGQPGSELHLTLLEDNKAEVELRRQQEDWRNMVAHDLRTPLTPVLATLLMLQENAQLGEQDRRLVELSISSARKMLGLLALYLDVAKLDAGLMEVKPVPVELGALVRRAAGTQEALAIQKKQSGSIDVPDTLKVQADEELLFRVIENLVSNAVKYSGEGTRILIGVEPGGDSVRLWVRDQGQGIRTQDLPRVFDRYHQAKARRSGGTQGTGLGLAFSKQALEAMGGRIFVTSEYGVGSEFSIVLPAA